jgi:hypothetical protein
MKLLELMQCGRLLQAALSSVAASGAGGDRWALGGDGPPYSPADVVTLQS